MASLHSTPFWICLSLLILFFWLIQKAKCSLWAVTLLVLPGTIIHESCHFLVGLFLNGKPVTFSVIPKREDGQIKLGSVFLVNLRWYNVFFIGMAPLIMLPGAYKLFVWITTNMKTLGSIPLGLGLFLVGNLAWGSIPSGQDFKMASRSPVGWMILGGLLFYGWSHLHAV